MNSQNEMTSWSQGPKQAFENKDFANLEARLFATFIGVIESLGLELYDLQYNVAQTKLTLYIQRPDTGTAVIEDCVAVDRALGSIIEAADWIPSKFVLEVSSPGVNRQLRFQEHFAKAHGEFVLLQLQQKLDQANHPGLPKKYWNNKKVRGRLVAHSATSLTLDLDGASVIIPSTMIKKATLDPDLWGRDNSKDNKKANKEQKK